MSIDLLLYSRVNRFVADAKTTPKSLIFSSYRADAVWTRSTGQNEKCWQGKGQYELLIIPGHQLLWHQPPENILLAGREGDILRVSKISEMTIWSWEQSFSILLAVWRSWKGPRAKGAPIVYQVGPRGLWGGGGSRQRMGGEPGDHHAGRGDRLGGPIPIAAPGNKFCLLSFSKSAASYRRH